MQESSVFPSLVAAWSSFFEVDRVSMVEPFCAPALVARGLAALGL